LKTKLAINKHAVQ